MLKYQKTFHENTTRGGDCVTNFDFLKDIPQFAAFADVAVAADELPAGDGICRQMDVFG